MCVQRLQLMDALSLALCPWSLQACLLSAALCTVQQLHRLITVCSSQSAGGTTATPSTAPLQQAAPPTTPASTSAVPQMQPGGVTVPAQTLSVPSSHPITRNLHDTALSDAASTLLAHTSTVEPVLAPGETDLKD